MALESLAAESMDSYYIRSMSCYISCIWNDDHSQSLLSARYKHVHSILADREAIETTEQHRINIAFLVYFNQTLTLFFSMLLSGGFSCQPPLDGKFYDFTFISLCFPFTLVILALATIVILVRYRTVLTFHCIYLGFIRCGS